MVGFCGVGFFVDGYQLHQKFSQSQLVMITIVLSGAAESHTADLRAEKRHHSLCGVATAPISD
ncbi:hypothetical protein [Kiloniella laminariae]|uniref:hypothetical protein n=1 Tax=Kiloniella laminariae TaxID=454162 RepID=UPI00037C1B39|nr:hypothetical protein [Kiloniella laminariae]